MIRVRSVGVALMASMTLIGAACVPDDPDPIGDAIAGVEEQALADEIISRHGCCSLRAVPRR